MSLFLICVPSKIEVNWNLTENKLLAGAERRERKEGLNGLFEKKERE